MKLTALLFALLAFLCGQANVAAAKPPNIVFFPADDLGWRTRHCMGAPLQGWKARACATTAKDGIATVTGMGAAPFLGLAAEKFSGPAVVKMRARSATGGMGKVEWPPTPQAADEVLGQFYFRVFHWQDAWFAMAKGGLLYRSQDGLTQFVPGTNPFPGSETRNENANTPGPRHVALHRVGNELRVYYRNIGDAPERILRRRIQLTADWKTWTASAPEEVLRPETDDEGAKLLLKPSLAGAMKGRENALRDLAIFANADGHVYLLYSVAGEGGIGIAELKSKP